MTQSNSEICCLIMNENYRKALKAIEGDIILLIKMGDTSRPVKGKADLNSNMSIILEFSRIENLLKISLLLIEGKT